jgi:hypothetical protein
MKEETERDKLVRHQVRARYLVLAGLYALVVLTLWLLS